jgi:gamma-glutamyltranspeptidase/glutathione hydrolase
MIRILIAFLLLVAPALGHAQGVVSSADPRASAAGQEILRKGGSATDAAMAMMLALTVVEPQSSGIGGGGFLLHHDGKSGVIDTIDGREVAPASARPDRFVRADGQPLPFMQAFPGGKSVGVPGNVALMTAAHAKWGRLPWADLFAPAIRLAREGFVVGDALEAALVRMAPVWADFPDARAIYWRNGAPVPVGTTLTNPALADFLEKLAGQGPDAFYKGANAAAVSNAVAQAPVNAATLTQEDMAGYRAKERAAVCSLYRVYTMCGMGPPSSGATTVFQILGMLERFNLSKLGKDNPASSHLISEAMRLAYADREKYLGDRDFVDVPVAGLLDPAYMRQRSKLISPFHSRTSYEAGMPPGAPVRTMAVQAEVPGTTHFVAVDVAGDVVSMTSTVEGPFGSQLIANGYFLNNELTDFTFAPEKDGALVANRVQAGKRPLSSMSPTIVYDAKGKPVLAIGSAGGKRIIMHVTKALIGVIDFGLSAQDAIVLPNIFMDGDDIVVEQGTWLADLAPALSKFGRAAKPGVASSKLNAVQYVDGHWTGAADPRSPGVALTQ